jgi:hypothetical protein
MLLRRPKVPGTSWLRRRRRTQRLEDVTAPVLFRLAALPESDPQDLLHVPQIAQASVDVVQPFFDEVLDFGAGRTAPRRSAEQQLHVIQGEANRLGGTNEPKPTQRFARVQAVVPRTPIFGP